MAIRKKGKWWFSDSQADIRTELARVGELNEYVPSEFADCKCECGGKIFGLGLDEDAGAAVRKCVACHKVHPIGDSEEYLDEAELNECACPCGEEDFEVTVGVSLYDNSEDVRWLYIGCRCTHCGLTAAYGDWKNEFPGFRELLKRV